MNWAVSLQNCRTNSLEPDFSVSSLGTLFLCRFARLSNVLSGNHVRK